MIFQYVQENKKYYFGSKNCIYICMYVIIHIHIRSMTTCSRNSAICPCCRTSFERWMSNCPSCTYSNVPFVPRETVQCFSLSTVQTEVDAGVVDADVVDADAVDACVVDACVVDADAADAESDDEYVLLNNSVVYAVYADYAD